MSRIYYIMGKSATGKDTIYKELLKLRTDLKTIIPYTTRPIRQGEKNGVEYYFTSPETLREWKDSGKIIELRTYETVMGHGATLLWMTDSLKLTGKPHF